jgi:hypothetical protein
VASISTPTENIAVEKLDHDRRPARLVDAELDPVGCGLLVLGQPRAWCGETRDLRVLSLVGLKHFRLFIFRWFEPGIKADGDRGILGMFFN